AERHGRELQREPARLPDSALHRLSHPVQVDVARREFGPGGRDADHRAAVEDLRGEALAAHPGPVAHAGPPGRAEPLGAAESAVGCHKTISNIRAPAGHAPGPFGIRACPPLTVTNLSPFHP